MKAFRCPSCANTVYFENHQCLSCGGALALATDRLEMVMPQADHSGYHACARRETADACNWAVSPGDANALCVGCRLTANDSDADPARASQRARVEAAKRSVVYTLLRLGLPFGPKVGVDNDKYGLMFRWAAPGGPLPTMTGHEDGVVTLNLAEADDAERETLRVRLGEPQRTVLGHLRHEVSHHLHQRFVERLPAETEFRALFGDERADYAQALRRHYERGPAADWPQHFISAYASSHPWEDWAETCAHYLLIVDATETATAWGLQLQVPDAQGVTPVACRRVGTGVPTEHVLRQQWLPVARFLNAMSRSIGLPDSYPFVLAEPVVQKLRFVDQVLRTASTVARAAA